MSEIRTKVKLINQYPYVTIQTRHCSNPKIFGWFDSFNDMRINKHSFQASFNVLNRSALRMEETVQFSSPPYRWAQQAGRR